MLPQCPVVGCIFHQENLVSGQSALTLSLAHPAEYACQAVFSLLAFRTGGFRSGDTRRSVKEKRIYPRLLRLMLCIAQTQQSLHGLHQVGQSGLFP